MYKACISQQPFLSRHPFWRPEADPVPRKGVTKGPVADPGVRGQPDVPHPTGRRRLRGKRCLGVQFTHAGVYHALYLCLSNPCHRIGAKAHRSVPK